MAMGWPGGEDASAVRMGLVLWAGAEAPKNSKITVSAFFMIGSGVVPNNTKNYLRDMG
jgi:hypothetical protein